MLFSTVRRLRSRMKRDAPESSPCCNDPASRGVTFEELRLTYREQVRGLIDGGVDVLLPETTFDTLNLKAAAAALGRKNATMTKPDKAERITGYVRGGISPLGTRTTLDTVIDLSSSKIGRLYCSGGRRGLDISIGLQDLVQLTNAKLASIAR